MINCPQGDLKSCQQTRNADSFSATYDRNALSCSFDLRSLLPPDQLNQTNFVVALSIVGNSDNKDRLYVQPTDAVEIYLEKVIEEEAGHRALTKYVVNPVYISSHQTNLGQSNITFAFNSFDIKHWSANTYACIYKFMCFNN